MKRLKVKRLKVAILGASGIGNYHAREFHNAGCDVCAILGSTEKSSIETALRLEREFGIKTNSYYDLYTLLKSEKLDAVSICTPSSLHSYQIKKCIEGNLNILCEKPFVFDSLNDNYNTAKELMELANKKDKVVYVNTQWPVVIPYFRKYIDFNGIKSFDMSIGSTRYKGIDMLTEWIPHINSMVLNLFSNGRVENINFNLISDDRIDGEFDFINNKSIHVTYTITYKEEKPTDIAFGFDGNKFKRLIGPNYRQQFAFNDTVFDIEDPLKLSLRDFIKAINNKDKSQKYILENIKLQDQILTEYLHSNKLE